MAFIVDKVVETYNYLFIDLADPRTNNFFLISSPWPILILTSLYLYICKSFGPRYMKDRPPYNLKNVVLIYNVYQVLMNLYIFHEGVAYMSSEKYSLKCAPVDYSDDPVALRALNGSWWYSFIKITEFLDTIFFVLRKKNNQVSFLHVYHHSMMAITTWVGARYLPGGHGALMATLNSFVHIVMYTYYLIAGLGPQYQKYVWWKKHVTVLQLAQFVVVLIHNLNPLFTDCSYPKFSNILMCFNSILFINLFGRFFYASYIKESAKNGAVKNGTVKNGSVTNGKATNGIHSIESTSKHSLHENGADKNGVSLNGKSKDV